MRGGKRREAVLGDGDCAGDGGCTKVSEDDAQYAISTRGIVRRGLSRAVLEEIARDTDGVPEGRDPGRTDEGGGFDPDGEEDCTGRQG